MSTPDVAIAAVTVAYLATLGAGLKLALACLPRARLVAPPKEQQRGEGTGEVAAPVPIGRAAS